MKSKRSQPDGRINMITEPTVRKSLGWVSRMNQKELDALTEFVKTWPIVKDFHGEFHFSKLSYCKDCFELQLDERGVTFRQTTEQLMVRMSEFLEGFRAACKAYGIQREEHLKDIE
jgi:hypothetical protein